MRLTVFSDYTLRVLIYLGMHPEGLCTVGEIAQAYDVSKNHLMKVAQHLAARGYADTVRGKGGGMRLKQPPEQINLGVLLRETERGSPLVECFGASSDCRIEPACSLRSVLEDAHGAFFEVLDRHTLADLLGSAEHLGSLLSTPTVPTGNDLSS